GETSFSVLLQGSSGQISDLFEDLKDGTKLLALLQILSGHPMKPEKGRMRLHQLNNINKALQLLADQYNVSNQEIFPTVYCISINRF
ncbi:hypothetical protein NP493_384g04024, partial [Ridgeia piscesae]